MRSKMPKGEYSSIKSLGFAPQRLRIDGKMDSMFCVQLELLSKVEKDSW